MKALRVIKAIMGRGRERVFLVEETEQGFLGSTFSISETDRNIECVKKTEYASLDLICKSKIFSSHYDKTILALDTAHAATIESSVSVNRVHPDTLITEGELDGLLFHALWSFLNKFRPLAARKLNTTELDLVIANIAVFGTKLQGHTVFNPMDFSGKEIEFFFRASFVSRSLLPTLERIARRSHSGPLVVERSAILASIVSKPGILFIVDHSKTHWYETGNECGFRGTFSWGSQNTYAALGNIFGVSVKFAPRIVEKFFTHRVSLRIQGIIEKTIREEYKHFRDFADESMQKENHELLKGEARVVYFEDQRGAALYPSDERFRINVDMPELFHDGVWNGERTIASALALFPYVHPQYEYLNQLLRRRAKWLVPLDVVKDKERHVIR